MQESRIGEHLERLRLGVVPSQKTHISLSKKVSHHHHHQHHHHYHLRHQHPHPHSYRHGHHTQFSLVCEKTPGS